MQSHSAILEELLRALERRRLPADLRAVLARFPVSFEAVIELSRAEGAEKDPREIQARVEALVRETLLSAVAAAS